jgi:hypothetical protein
LYCNFRRDSFIKTVWADSMKTKKLLTFSIIILFCFSIFTGFQFPLASAQATASFGDISHSSGAWFNANIITGSNYTATSSGTADSITFKSSGGSSATATVQAALYYYQNFSKVGVTEQIVGYSAYSEYNLTFSDPKPTVFAGETYWIMFLTDTTISAGIAVDNEYIEEDPKYYFTYSAGSFPDSIASGSLTTAVMTIQGKCWHEEGIAQFTLSMSNIPADAGATYTLNGVEYNSNQTYFIDEGTYTLVVPDHISYWYDYNFVGFSSGANTATRFVVIADVTTLTAYYTLVSALPPENIGNKVQTVNSSQAIRFQEKTFYTQNRYWIFYNDKNSTLDYGSVFYTSSPDGLSWTEPVWVISPIEWSGENVQAILDTNGDVNLFLRTSGILWYMKGTPAIDGSIAWLTEVQEIWNPALGNTDFYAGLDSSGYPYVSWCYGNTISNQTVYIKKSMLNNGTWLDDPDWNPKVISDAPGHWSNTMLVPLTNNKFYIIYFDCDTHVYGKLWDGSTLGAEETCTTTHIKTDYITGRETWSRAIVIDNSTNKIYFAFINTGNQIQLTIRNYTTSTWTESNIQNNVINGASPTFAWYTWSTWAEANLQIYWINSSTSIAYKNYIAGVWSSPLYAATNLDQPIPLFYQWGEGNRLNPFGAQFGENIGLLFVVNSTEAGRFDIRFALFKPQVPIPPTPGPMGSIIPGNGTVPDTLNVAPFFQYLYAGNLVGFYSSIFLWAFIQQDILFASLTLLFLAPIYIRTRSLLLPCIIFVLIGGFYIGLMPAVSGFAILLETLAIAGVLWGLVRAR